jgi:methylated-DNA-[protein]-cysteine S-methyltransferase
MTGAGTDEGLRGLWFLGQKYYPQNTARWIENPGYPIVGVLKDWLNRYFAGENPEMHLRLTPQGTDFQLIVWDILQRVPYGKTTTYGEIAEQIRERRAIPMSAQAVGGAVGRNPISLLIPCHRVIGSGGGLTGYAGGLEKKNALLALEQHNH